MIIAHRGYAKDHPENTIAAFDAAFDAGADGIETDVRIAGDGEIVVSHDPVKNSKGVLSLDALFAYIAEKKDTPFFLEIKQPSPVLLAAVAKRIAKMNAWDRVHLIGFSKNLKAAVRAQRYFPKLCVDQILKVPLWSSYVRKPKKSHAVYIGWLDGVPHSELFFKRLVSPERLAKLRQRFEELGFAVYGGVINREDGMRLFREAGINDIFTDEVTRAVSCLKQQPQS